MDIALLHRKESLILTTIDVINELGIQGLSTREIAKRQGVSEATLFRHYKSKSELLLAVLDYYSQFDSDIVKSIELKQLSPRAAIEFAVNSYVEYYENYPAITAITQLSDVLAYDEILSAKVKEIIIYRRTMVSKFIENAQIADEIKTSIGSEALADVFIGFIQFNILNWRLNKFNYSLKSTTMDGLKSLLDSFKI